AREALGPKTRHEQRGVAHLAELFALLAWCRLVGAEQLERERAVVDRLVGVRGEELDEVVLGQGVRGDPVVPKGHIYMFLEKRFERLRLLHHVLAPSSRYRDS